MLLIKEAEKLANFISQQKNQGKTIGFVPTMGALHDGHLSLISLSAKNNDLTVCSIFVNPTQFNNPDDLEKYPVTIEKDILALEATGCDILFLPSKEQIYPPHWKKKHYDLGLVETILEGKYRPGHFQGVCQVVDRLLEITQPNQIYFGQKDYQQCMVIKKLLQLLGKDKEIQMNIAPTIRQEDGLALSSRNLRLNDQEKRAATQLYRELSDIKNKMQPENLEDLKEKAIKNLEARGFRVDYLEIISAEDLSDTRDKPQQLVALVAATLNDVRLIDNLILN